MMSTDPTALRFLLVALTIAGSAACDHKSDDERCRELANYLDGRSSILPIDCTDSSDCQVVFVRPDTPVAASSGPDDPQLARVLAAYQSDCEPIPQAVGNLAAVCIERTIDEVRPALDGSGDVVTTVALGRSCVLRGDYTVPDAGPDDADAGSDAADGSGDAAEDTQPCGCLDCPAEEFCHACACVPATPCGQGCAAADTCGALDTMGLGTTVDVCVASCDASVEADPTGYSPFVGCLSVSPCATIENCASRLP